MQILCLSQRARSAESYLSGQDNPFSCTHTFNARAALRLDWLRMLRESQATDGSTPGSDHFLGSAETLRLTRTAVRMLLTLLKFNLSDARRVESV